MGTEQCAVVVSLLEVGRWGGKREEEGRICCVLEHTALVAVGQSTLHRVYQLAHQTGGIS